MSLSLFFVIRKIEDLQFSVEEASIDRSDIEVIVVLLVKLQILLLL